METTELKREYPRVLKAKGGISVKLQRLTPQDLDRVLAFARALDEDDVLFLRVDLTRPEAIERIIQDQSQNRRVTLLATSDGEVVGYGSLGRRELDWMRHLGEIRVIVSSKARGQGLGASIAKELMAVAHELGMTKVVAQMVREQEGARRLFEHLGFSAEALLTDWVIDRRGRTRDLVVMSHDVTSLTN